MDRAVAPSDRGRGERRVSLRRNGATRTTDGLPRSGNERRSVQLHLLAPATQPAAAEPAEAHVPVAPETTSGVATDDRLGAIASRSLPASKLSVRGILAIVFTCLSLLGQGERCRVDMRFVTPSATL